MPKPLLLAIFISMIIGYASLSLFKVIRKDLINDFNIEQTLEYKNLDQKLTKWCDHFYLVKPTLKLRFNSSNEGYYQTNLISLLVTKDSFFNNDSIDYLEVMLAHEFGHHLLRIKVQEEMSPLQEEQGADLVALSLVGYESIEKVFLKEMKGPKREAPYPELEFSNRLKFLKEFSSKDLKTYELFQKFSY